MFIAEFLICLATGKCGVMQEVNPVIHKTEEACLAHAEAKLPELREEVGNIKYVIVRCVAPQGVHV